MTATTRKRSAKPPRTVDWTPNADPFSATAGALAIAQGEKIDVYVVTEFASRFPGREFHLSKLVGGGEGYDVFTCARGVEGDSCNCPDATNRHRACKHVLAIRKLMEMDRI